MMKLRKNKKGFTLIELMIVVAIIGILAAVAIPMYKNYMQKARVTSLILPAVHSFETNIAAYYALHDETWPTTAATVSLLASDANTQYISGVVVAAGGTVTFTIVGTNQSDATEGSLWDIVDAYGGTLTATATTDGAKITGWEMGGVFASGVGLR